MSKRALALAALLVAVLAHCSSDIPATASTPSESRP